MTTETEDYDPEFDNEEPETVRFCNSSCPHYDELNGCCWQAGKWGLCFNVDVEDECHLGYKWGDGS